MGWVINSTPRQLYSQERDPVLIVQEAGWAPGPVWTGAENLSPTGIRSPDLPARSDYLLRPVLRQDLTNENTDVIIRQSLQRDQPFKVKKEKVVFYLILTDFSKNFAFYRFPGFAPLSFWQKQHVGGDEDGETVE
jgi:hypothetical protein